MRNTGGLQTFSGGRACVVQVWWIAVDAAPRSLEIQKRYLSEAEWQRAGRLRREADRRRFVLCRAALRQVLGSVLATRPERVELVEQRYGKPALGDRDATGDLSFNVAHSGQWGCVALASGPPVGVDVEMVRQPTNLDLMIQMVLSQKEQCHFASLQPAEQLPAFLRYWTRKEALAKATGLGLQLPFGEIEVDLGRRTAMVKLPARLGEDAGFQVQELKPPATGYFAALALGAGQMPQVETQLWKEG